MANKTKVTVPIYSDFIYERIKERSSIRKIAKEIGYHDKTIRRYLKSGELPIELVYLLSAALEIDPIYFARLNIYTNRLMELGKERRFKNESRNH